MLKTKDGYAKVIGTSYQGSSDYLLLSNGDSKAISSLSVNYATSAGNADTVDGQHASAFSYKSWWHWSGQSGQPSWIWGGNSENNYYVYNPSNFRVNYAKSAGSVAWNNVTGRPSTFAPAAHTHKWADITDHITKLSQLTNDKGFVTGSVNGNTITINGSSTTWSDTWRPITDNYELGKSDTSLSSLGSLTLYNDLLGTIPNPTDYYWANNKVSNKSTTDAIVQVKAIGVGCAASIDNSIIATNWIRTTGKTGLYFQDYEGGLYMSDNTWIRTWNGKALQVDNTIRSNNLQVMYKGDETVVTSAAVLENAITLVYGTSTSSNSINTYLRGTNVTLQVKKGTSINYNAFQVTADYIYCNNYCDMKNGAAVSNGNFTVQNNSYLAQKKDAKVGIGTTSPTYKLDVNGQMSASGFHHSSINSDNYILLAGGGYKSFGGDSNHPIFLGYLNLYHGNDGTIDSYFDCLGYSVLFTYTRGGNYCKISIPNTTHQVFFIKAAIASVNYSGGRMDNWTGEHKGDGAWWLHCYAYNLNEVRVKGFRNSSGDNDSWWGGNPLYSSNGSANVITVCLFGYVAFK